MEKTTTAPEEVQTPAAEAVEKEESKQKRSAKEVLANYFMATRIAYIAIFTALSFALRFWEIVLLPGTPVGMLKLDFSNIFPLLGGFALGPIAGVTIGVLKEVLWMFFSSTGGVGELANIVMLLPFVLIPSIGYKYHKGIKSVILLVSIACVFEVAWCFPVNWLLNFPVFVGFNWKFGMSFFINNYVWGWVMLFNLIKWVVTAVVVMLIYKSISQLIKLTNEKFTKIAEKQRQKKNKKHA